MLYEVITVFMSVDIEYFYRAHVVACLAGEFPLVYNVCVENFVYIKGLFFKKPVLVFLFSEDSYSEASEKFRAWRYCYVFAKEHGKCQRHSRITSYNVCYTKLLRLRKFKSGAV